MDFWTPDNLKSTLAGTWLSRADASPITGASTDTRTLAPGQVFIALRGERTDGHRHVAEAVAKGASMVVVDRPEPSFASLRVPVLAVADSTAALLRLGAAYRRTLESTRVIGVGGSNGKTTTVRLVAAALGAGLRGTSSPRSFNNAIGVPLTLLGGKRSDQFLVCEIGTNAPGEIAPLALAAAPDIAVITSIGREHLEGLGSLEGVLREEVSLLSGLREGGLAVLNADAPGLVEAARPMLAGQRATMVTFGEAASADLRIGDVSQTPDGVSFMLNGRQRLRLGLLGAHNAWNAAAAFAVARRLGVEPGVIAGALEAAAGPPMRLERRVVRGVTFINDAYNANPESVLAALRAFGEAYGRSPSRRVVVLGDMLELGDAAPASHREVGIAAGGCGWIDLLVTVGVHSAATARAARGLLGATRVAEVEAADAGGISRAAGLLRPGDVVLLKASRGVALERVVDLVAEPAADAKAAP